MKNSDISEAYNGHIAVILREQLACSYKTKQKTTYKALAEYLNVKQQSVSSWVNGTTTPDTKHIKPIAEYFGISCDYLLGRTTAPAPDDFIKAVVERLGLSEEAIELFETMKKGIYTYCKCPENALDIVNYFLESADFDDIMEGIETYIMAESRALSSSKIIDILDDEDTVRVNLDGGFFRGLTHIKKVAGEDLYPELAKSNSLLQINESIKTILVGLEHDINEQNDYDKDVDVVDNEIRQELFKLCRLYSKKENVNANDCDG